MKKTPEEWNQEIVEANERLIAAVREAVKNYAEVARWQRASILIAYLAIALLAVAWGVTR